MYQTARAAIEGHAGTEGTEERTQVPRAAARGLREPPECRQVEAGAETPTKSHRSVQRADRADRAADGRGGDVRRGDLPDVHASADHPRHRSSQCYQHDSQYTGLHGV